MIFRVLKFVVLLISFSFFIAGILHYWSKVEVIYSSDNSKSVKYFNFYKYKYIEYDSNGIIYYQDSDYYISKHYDDRIFQIELSSLLFCCLACIMCFLSIFVQVFKFITFMVYRLPQTQRKRISLIGKWLLIMGSLFSFISICVYSSLRNLLKKTNEEGDKYKYSVANGWVYVFIGTLFNVVASILYNIKSGIRLKI